MVHGMEHEDAENEEMEGEEMEGEWGHHKNWGMNKCGCPMCMRMKMMKKMAMSGGGMMGTPWMKHMAGMSMGMGMGTEGTGWRKFTSSEEKIAKLEDYLKDLQLEEKAVREKIEYIRSKFEKQ